MVNLDRVILIMKSVLITGAATGMGKAYADLLSAKGWLVFAGCIENNPPITDWDTDANIIRIQCDVTQPDQITDARRKVEERTGGTLDLLINNAGAGLACGAVESAYMENARVSMEVNYWGIINMVHGFAEPIKKAKGRIINVSSPANYLTMPLGFAYCTSKSAAKSLSAHIKMELAPFGVQVTNLEPGGVESQMIIDGRNSEQTWGPMPTHLRNVYQETFVSGMEGVSDVVKFIPPADFAELVYKKVISQKKWKTNYQVGPGAKTIALLHRLLPVELNQKLWKHVFSKKPT